MKPTILKGNVWYITDQDGKLINDIDTDMIYHNAYLAVTDVSSMGKYAFGNLDLWKDFPSKVKKGDIIIAGENFGSGSSRQHAVDCFLALGVSLIIARSIGAIYKRNAINSGMPILEFPEIVKYKIQSGDILEIDLEKAHIKNITTDEELRGAKSFSRVQMNIYQAGNLFAYMK